MSYRLPAEWEPQSAVLLTWPHAETDWADFLTEAEQTYREIAVQISRRQTLILVCQDEGHHDAVIADLLAQGANGNNLVVCLAKSDDTWARDHADLTVFAGSEPLLLDFQFNGWGGKYPAAKDNAITPTLAQAGLFKQTPLQHLDFTLEGGAIETDGQGTLLATRSSVLTESRNPGMTEQAVEQLLTAKLGIDHFLWLDHGHLSGDDTDGHIDTLARFVDNESILYVTAYPDDPDYPALRMMRQELETFRTQAGEPYRLIPLPPITPIFADDQRRLPASYANFLIINGAVLLPIYGDKNDTAAIECLHSCFPEHEIIPIDCRSLIRQNGSLHCITMQFPAGIQFQH